MITLMILCSIVVYIVLAVLFVKFVKKITNVKIYKWLAVVFVILLPIWDVVLGTAVYYIGCRYIPKVAIYETAETDGIYFDGLNDYYYKFDRRGRQITDEELTRIGSLYYIFPKGYTFAEALVTKMKEGPLYFTDKKITPVIYRCVPLPIDWSRPDFQRTSCSIVNDIKSKYMVKVTTTKAGVAEIRYKKVINRSTGKLMAECNLVKLWSCFPFFNWLGWQWGSREQGSLSNPAFDKYEYFEYDVLKPIKKRSEG